ncbi:MAG: methyltransferase domain-containing protein [Gemmataceae bacterium]
MTVTGILRQLSRPPRRLARRALERAGLHHQPPAGDPRYRLRVVLAEQFLAGDGLEIGALHHPLPVPPAARVRYVDRLDTAGLRQQFPELAGEPLAPVDIIDDAERLATIADASQDFVIANHLLEHTQNPIGALRRFLEVLKPGGSLYLAIPDQRGTFDRDRPLTTLDHLHRDHAEGPQWSYFDHLNEYVTMVERLTGPAHEQRVQQLAASDYRIHFHVWTCDTFWEFLNAVRRRYELPFTVRAFVYNVALSEAISVLAKT